MQRKVTIKMIATRTNTSIGTVDRALSNRPGINPETKSRVLRAAQEMGYSPNQMASALARRKTINIAVVYPKAPGYFYDVLGRGVARAREELRDYGIAVHEIRSATIDLAEQEHLLKSTEWSRYDGVAINISGIVLSPYIDRLVEGGIPVVTFNSDVPRSRRLFYVGHDLRQSGRLGAEIMGKMLGGVGKVIVLGAFSATPTFIERYGGFCEVIQNEYPDIAIYPCAECRGDFRKASQTIDGMLREMPDVKGLFLTGTSSTVGAAEAVRCAGVRGITVIGYDLTRRIADAIADGWCTATLFQDPIAQGHQAVRLLSRHLLEGWLPPEDRIIQQTQILMKYNVEHYRDADLPDEA